MRAPPTDTPTKYFNYFLFLESHTAPGSEGATPTVKPTTPPELIGLPGAKESKVLSTIVMYIFIVFSLFFFRKAVLLVQTLLLLVLWQLLCRKKRQRKRRRRRRRRGKRGTRRGEKKERCICN